MYGYIVPNILQKDLASIKKYVSKARIIFNPEIVDNINDVETSQPNRNNISHKKYTNFIDPPSSKIPSSRINTNRVPPTPPPT